MSQQSVPYKYGKVIMYTCSMMPHSTPILFCIAYREDNVYTVWPPEVYACSSTSRLIPFSNSSIIVEGKLEAGSQLLSATGLPSQTTWPFWLQNNGELYCEHNVIVHGHCIYIYVYHCLCLATLLQKYEAVVKLSDKLFKQCWQANLVESWTSSFSLSNYKTNRFLFGRRNCSLLERIVTIDSVMGHCNHWFVHTAVQGRRVWTSSPHSSR